MRAWKIFKIEFKSQALPGVRSTTASLETGIVTVAAVAEDQLQAAAVQLPAVVQAIQELGFGAEPHFSQEAYLCDAAQSSRCQDLGIQQSLTWATKQVAPPVETRVLQRSPTAADRQSRLQ